MLFTEIFQGVIEDSPKGNREEIFSTDCKQLFIDYGRGRLSEQKFQYFSNCY